MSTRIFSKQLYLLAILTTIFAYAVIRDISSNLARNPIQVLQDIDAKSRHIVKLMNGRILENPRGG